MKTLKAFWEEVRPKMQQKKLIRTLGEIKIYEVDGSYIRDYIDVEFTNVGIHSEFDFIPENEIWLDETIQPSERKFLIDHALIKRKLKLHHVGDKKAEEIAARKEKDERRSSSGEMARIQPKKDFDPRKKLWKDIDGIKVYIVKAREIRDAYYVDFTEGGHSYVYGFIPKDEIWIGDDVYSSEWNYVLLHEYTERDNMKNKRWSYDKAHEKASEVEHIARLGKI